MKITTLLEQFPSFMQNNCRNKGKNDNLHT